MNSKTIFVIAAMLMLGGCMVGPNYSKPAVPISPAFKEGPPASFKEGDGWKTATPIFPAPCHPSCWSAVLTSPPKNGAWLPPTSGSKSPKQPIIQL
jgi:hypothetical protein